MIIYYETDLGCGIEEYRNLETARRGIQQEIGTFHDIQLVEEATLDNIAWVYSMDGYVPKKALEMLKKGK